jgi:hypothetical protein
LLDLGGEPPRTPRQLGCQLATAHRHVRFLWHHGEGTTMTRHFLDDKEVREHSVAGQQCLRLPERFLRLARILDHTEGLPGAGKGGAGEGEFVDGTGGLRTRMHGVMTAG